jgi:two-component system sensor histidine kinase/response regulator
MVMEITPTKPVNVLLVDDDHDDYLLIKHTFSKIENSPFILEWTSSFEEAEELIASDTHDIYLIDYLLGAHTGLDLLKLAHPEKRRQPFILLTGSSSEALEWQSLELAASDYLVKGSFDANLLSRTLTYALQRKKVEEQRVQHLMQLNRSKDEFISIASHQLRTPATGVKQYVGMLLEGFAGELPPNQRYLLEKAYDSNERQLKIVSDLLKVAQVDAGKVILQKKAVHIGEFVGQVIHEQVSILRAREQELEYLPPETDFTLEIDEASVRMVLENIIDNASKYSEENSTIRVSVEEKRKTAVISIADEGVGINPKDKSRLFEKFSRLDNSLSTKVGGTGLGLYWARKIVTLHNGRISYNSNTDRGTTFVIKLPKNDKV